jgi:hypothetical protein
MKRGARAYLSIAFFTSLVVVISPLFATGSQSASTQASSDRGSAILENRARSAIASARVKSRLAHLCTEFSGRVQDTQRKRYGKPSQHGKCAMTAFKEKLEPHEIDDLLQYLRTL